MSRISQYATRHPWLGAALHAYDRRQFVSQRADYYDYLAALLHGMRGSRSLKEVFQADASRYGLSSPRGRLSARWLRTYQLASGDLYTTWLAEFPVAELGLLRMAQSFGNITLVRTLAELSRMLVLNREASRILVATLWVAALALILVLAMMIAVPYFTVPRLLQAFSAVPPEYYGSLTRQLISFSDVVRSGLMFIVVLLAGGAGLLLWSLPSTYGPVRKALEPYSLWRIYRYVQALRFLAMLALVLGRDDSGSTQLRSALIMQKTGANPWLLSHINAMLARIDMGVTGADTFDSRLLDQEHFWFLSDMIMARGLHEGLALTCDRVRGLVLGSVARQAVGLRWGILLTCLGLVLALGLWHYAVIDELRRSLMLFHASH